MDLIDEDAPLPFLIEEHPLPDRRSTRRKFSPLVIAARQMKIGQCITLPLDQALNATQHMRRGTNWTHDFEQRQVEVDGKVMMRIWRTK